MANREFFYFFAPTWDYPPDGSIRLGNVITSVKKPHLPLSNISPAEGPALLETSKKNVRCTNEKLRGGQFSIFTKFLSILGFGVNVGAKINNTRDETFVFDTLETTHFIPTPDYLQTCVESNNVRRFLAASRYRKPVYIITGVKVVHGAQANTATSSTLGGGVVLEVDGTLPSGGMIPIGGGPRIEAESGNKTSTSWDASTDFVFAFRVSKVFAGKVNQVVSEEEYRKGSMLDGGEEGSLRMSIAQVDVIKVEDPSAEDEGFDREELVDDGNIVLCALPRQEDIA